MDFRRRGFPYVKLGFPHPLRFWRRGDAIKGDDLRNKKALPRA